MLPNEDIFSILVLGSSQPPVMLTICIKNAYYMKFLQKKKEKDKGMLANHHKLHKGDASRMMVITKQPQPKDL